MTKLLESNDKEGFTGEEIAYIAGTLIEAGTDTTRTTLLELIAGTAMYPEWITRAREELDAVCGDNADRLPEFDDRDRLPMIKAAIKEAVRWR
jgi:cytochrome P450